MPVEVLLKNKIDKLGAEADVVSVRPGYARNFLVPQGHAVLATSATKRQIEQLRQKRAAREAAEMNAAQEVAGKLNKLKLAFVLTAGQGQDKVFGSVTAHDIIEKLKSEGYEVDRKALKLEKAIKETGDHEVIVALHSEVQAKLKINVSVPAAEVSEEEEGKGKKGFARKTKKSSE
ncbi:large subunit ribosomal protein L9 [Verrucomicrobium sp. GAS474]|uniref:50S ribosomal protein L9 n=1 Tax=Verrucomicrobium sp. GAS474 TaxID=1882831 RepID=UPI00087ACF6E|nr:50S ribosomal protein L9 [Verrucomicrobium sp. GAS474]SDU10174.1 large subunit ribosomal protein L9 [Verrucomicrobium sp. GAS474]